MSIPAPQQIKLLALLAVALGFHLKLATAAGTKCNLPAWPEWEQVDLAVDPRPKELATESLKDYLQGLEQTSSGFRCDWKGEGLDLKAACLEVR